MSESEQVRLTVRIPMEVGGHVFYTQGNGVYTVTVREGDYAGGMEEQALRQLFYGRLRTANPRLNEVDYTVLRNEWRDPESSLVRIERPPSDDIVPGGLSEVGEPLEYRGPVYVQRGLFDDQMPPRDPADDPG